MKSSTFKKLALLLLVLGISGTLLSDRFKGTAEHVDMASFPVYGSAQQNSLDGWVQFRAVETTHLVTATSKFSIGKNDKGTTTYHSLYLARDSKGNTLVYDDVSSSSYSSSSKKRYDGSVPVTLYGQLSTVRSKFSHYSDYRSTLGKYGDYDLVVADDSVNRVTRYVQTDTEKIIRFLLYRAYYLIAAAALLGLVGVIMGKAGR